MTYAISADPDETPGLIWVCAICHGTRRKRVKINSKYREGKYIGSVFISLFLVRSMGKS